MKRLHVVPERAEWNGVFQVARMLAQEDGGRVVGADELTAADCAGCEEVVVHGMWLPKEWRACRLALRAGARLVRMTHGSLSPIYLERQGKWKKRLVSPIERRLMRRAGKVLVTCEAERRWVRRWLGEGANGPLVELTDVKRFFKFQTPRRPSVAGRALRVLYLGMRHPLKGVQQLRAAVAELGPAVELRIESRAVGAEKAAAWAWCDVLCLPTLSENFGLVVAEALERGKFVITTDGAPAWEGLRPEQGVYLRGYCAGDAATRVRLLRSALEGLLERKEAK